MFINTKEGIHVHKQAVCLDDDPVLGGEVEDGLLLRVNVGVEEDLVRDWLDFCGVEELLHLIDVEVAYADAPAHGKSSEMR